MFNYPSAPLPGEHAASVIYRTFQQNCHQSIENWFNSHLKTPFFEMPQRIWVPVYDNLADAFQAYFSKASFIKQFTNLTDYTLFLSPQNFDSGYPSCIFHDLAKRKFEHGLQVITDRVWRYCPDCAVEDERRFGTAYFHTEHQQYHRLSCLRHGCYLKATQTQKFSLPPLDREREDIIAEVSILERQLQKLMNIIKQMPSPERKPRLLSLLRQKLGVSRLHRLRDHNLKRMREAHFYLAEAFNNTPMRQFFRWSTLCADRYPLNAPHGLLTMLQPHHSYHPMIYLMMAVTFLDEQEQNLLVELPFRGENSRDPLPLVIIPESFKAPSCFGRL